MTYRLLAFDLDGTLLGNDLQIRPASIAAIQTARELGYKVVMVTGRHHIMAWPYHHQLNLDTPLLACNGTYAWDFARGEALFAKPLTKAEATALLGLIRLHDVHALLYLRDAQAYETLEPHLTHLLHWAEALPAEVRPNMVQVADFESLLRAADLVWKYAVSSVSDGKIEPFIAQVEAELGLACERSGHNRVDVASAGNSKGALLLEWIATQGITPAEVVAFGDNYNDLSMLQGVGLGVAMGNAEAPVREQAARVIGKNDTDAIADFLRDEIFANAVV